MGRYDPNAAKLGSEIDAYNQFLKKDKPIQVNLEFTRDRKAMSVMSDDKLFIKGAPDYLLNNTKYVLTKSGKKVPITD